MRAGPQPGPLALCAWASLATSCGAPPAPLPGANHGHRLAAEASTTKAGHRETPDAALHVEGAVRDPTGRPVQDAIVAAFPVATFVLEARPEVHARTGSDGRYKLALRADADYALTVTAPGLSPAHRLSANLEGRNRSADADFTVGAEPAREIRGLLLTHDGRPAANGTVRVFPPYTENKGQEIYLTVPDANGAFRISLRTSRFLLIGEAPGATFSVGRVAPEEQAPLVEIRLRPPSTPTPTNAVTDLRQIAVPVDLGAYETKQAHGSRLQANLCAARIVGIGESTHGSSEFTRLKGRMLFELSQCGFNVFLIEADMSVGAELDDYVLTGRGDPALLTKKLESWPYGHEEFLSLVHAIRAHNVRSASPIHVLGFDPYLSRDPAEKLLSFIAKRNPRTWRTAPSWLIDTYVPNGKAVLSAHNGHVHLASPVWRSDAVGDLLTRRLGDKYISIGVFFGRGAFVALELIAGKIGDLKEFAMGDPPPGTMESILDRVDDSAFYVDMQSLSGQTHSWLEGELPCRELGSMVSAEAWGLQHVAPALAFRAIAFIPRLTAIKLLPD